MASEPPDRETRPADDDDAKPAKRDRPDPPVGTEDPVTDGKKTLPLADLNSADDE